MMDLAGLNVRSRYILKRRLDGQKAITIGREMGLCMERIRDTERIALQKMDDIAQRWLTPEGKSSLLLQIAQKQVASTPQISRKPGDPLPLLSDYRRAIRTSTHSSE